MQEATELIDLTPYDNVRPRVLFKIIVVSIDLLLEDICLLCEIRDRVTHL